MLLPQQIDENLCQAAAVSAAAVEVVAVVEAAPAPKPRASRAKKTEPKGEQA